MKGLAIAWLVWAVAVLVYSVVHVVRERASYAETIASVLATSKQHKDRDYCARMAEGYAKRVENYSTPGVWDQHLPKSWSADRIAEWRSERIAYESRKARQYANPDWCQAEALRLHYVAQVYGEMSMWRPIADALLIVVVFAGGPLVFHGLVLVVFRLVWKPMKLRARGRTTP